MRAHFLCLLGAPTLSAAAFTSQAFDINDQLSADGFLLGAGQCQSVSALLPAQPYGEIFDDTVHPPRNHTASPAASCCADNASSSSSTAIRPMSSF